MHRTKEPGTPRPRRISVYEMTAFALFAALIFMCDFALDLAMNVELVSTLMMTFTVVYRRRALIPIYLYIFLYLCVYGFSVYNAVYLYIWLVLWGVTMLLPRRMPTGVACVVYPLVCGLFGLSFGALYAPGWALAAGLSFRNMVRWWQMGIPADIIHAVGNVAFGMLVLPLSLLLLRLDKRLHKLN